MVTKRIVVAVAVAGAAAILARRTRPAVPASARARLGAYFVDTRNRLPQGITIIGARRSSRAQETPASAQDNATAARTVYDAFNSHDFDRAAALVAEEAEWRNVAFGTTFRGPAGLRDYDQSWATAFPDGRVEITNLVAAGEWVVAEFTGRGTHTGALRGPVGEIAATGRPVAVQFCDVVQIRNGKIVGGRSYFDSATLM